MTLKPLTTQWVPTGTRVSGESYAVAIVRDADDLARYGVRLSLVSVPELDRRAVVVPASSWTAAYELGERFAHCCRAWYVARQRLADTAWQQDAAELERR